MGSARFGIGVSYRRKPVRYSDLEEVVATMTDVISPSGAVTADPPAHQHHGLLDAVRGQPRAVWVTRFAAVIAFMGIGLVDPILKSIAAGLDASPSQVTLLFSSYIF